MSSFGFMEFLKMGHFVNEGFFELGREAPRAPPFWVGFEIKMAKRKGEASKVWAILVTQSNRNCGILNPPKFIRGAPFWGGFSKSTWHKKRAKHQ